RGGRRRRVDQGAGVGRRGGCVFVDAGVGIRAKLVAGVQTCALPILAEARRGRGAVGRDQRVAAVARPLGVQVDEGEAGGGAAREIGRASCRERVWGRVVGGGRRGGRRGRVDQGAGVGRGGGGGRGGA